MGDVAVVGNEDVVASNKDEEEVLPIYTPPTWAG